MKRTPVTLKIKFKSETLEQFIERYAVDVSQGGIFIRTKEPLAVGTAMKFEFQLRDASPLIAGEGTVVWTRENDPSRPAIAPGMGVRFDRLGEGSQSVLERILADKAKGSGRQTETTKPPMFADTPTRVAPAPLAEEMRASQRDMAARKGAPQARDYDSSNDRTPLPQPMPFHSDADEFPEEAFEEQTKVRSLDELVAQTALASGSAQPVERSTRPRADSTLAEPPMPDPVEPRRFDQRTSPVPLQDRDSAPILPSPPSGPAASSASHDAEPMPTLMDDAPARAERAALGLELPKPVRHDSPVAPRQSGSIPTAAASIPAPSKTTMGMAPPKAAPAAAVGPRPSAAIPRAAVTEPATISTMATKPSSGAPAIIILILLAVAAAGAAVWFLVLRQDASEDAIPTKKHVATDNGTNGTGSNGSAAAVNTGSNGSGVVVDNGSNGSAAVVDNGSNGSATGSNGSAGSAVAMTTATGSNTGSASAPTAPMVDTVVAANADKATVEIEGTVMHGPAPFTAKLEKGKAYKARVTAAGFTALEVDLKGGDEKVTAKLVAKTHVLTVTSDPPGAAIFLDNAQTGKVTPSDVELTKAQASRPRLRVSLRHGGFRQFDQVIDAAAWTENPDKLVTTVTGKLVVAPIVQRPVDNTPHDNGSGSAAPTSGNTGETPTGSGSASTGTGTGTPPPTTPTTPPPTTPPVTAPTTPTTPPPTSSGSLSKPPASGAEPEPDFNKRE